MIRKPIRLGFVLFGLLMLGNVLMHSPQAAALPAPVVFAADPSDSCNSGFFGLEPWYEYMITSDPSHSEIDPKTCNVKCFNVFDQKTENECGETASDIPGVFLALIDDMLRIAGLVAVAFVIVGSFQYVGSRGNPERTASAQSTILSALTGLAVAMVAVAIVAFLGNQLGS